MGYFEACANPVRTDATGRRVIVPFRWFGPVYLLRSDAEITRVRRGVKWMQIASFAAIIAAGVGGPARMLQVIIPLILCQILWMYLVVRGLVGAGVKSSDMPRIPRGEALAQSNAALGKSLLWTIRVGALGMNAFFLWGALHFGDTDAWLGAALFGLLNCIQMYDFVQERSYRNSRASLHPA